MDPTTAVSYLYAPGTELLCDRATGWWMVVPQSVQQVADLFAGYDLDLHQTVTARENDLPVPDDIAIAQTYWFTTTCSTGDLLAVSRGGDWVVLIGVEGDVAAVLLAHQRVVRVEPTSVSCPRFVLSEKDSTDER